MAGAGVWRGGRGAETASHIKSKNASKNLSDTARHVDNERSQEKVPFPGFGIITLGRQPQDEYKTGCSTGSLTFS